MSTGLSQRDAELTCVLVPQRETTLLLPNVAVAEVLDGHQALERVDDDGRPWRIGHIAWRGHRLPVLALDALDDDPGVAAPSPSEDAALLVINRMGAYERVAFYALLAPGMPRLVRLVDEDLVPAPEAPRTGELMRVYLGEELAAIPDLHALEGMIVQDDLLPA